MTDFTAALWITLIGMGLVFVAILLLWGMMALIGRIPDGKQEEPGPEVLESADVPTLADGPTPADKAGAERKRKAAAAGVAVALAQRQALPPLAVAVAVAAVAAARARAGAPSAEVALNGHVSPWQAALRSSRFDQRNAVYHRKTRG